MQMQTLMVLLYDYRAKPNIPNAQGKTALDIARTVIAPPKGSKATPEAIREHIAGFLEKKHLNLKLPGDTLLKEVRQEEKKRRQNELKRLKQELNQKISSRGIDLRQFFTKFDKNGDGVFS